MDQTYFLGANTKDGFFSLYGGFPAGKNTLLHIIKGGPGTGKSGFMRRIGEAAEKQGLQVEYVLCSGDPASLDGVYIPALEAAWVDGTAPHVIEPRSFGADADYVNLGKFCRLPFSEEEKNYVNQITADYKALYERAYSYISAAAAVDRAADPQLFQEAEKASMFKRIDGILDRSLGRASLSTGESLSRFYSAVSCLGEFRLNGELENLCKLVYQFDDGLGGAAMALAYAAEGAKRRGARIICCPSPMDPQRLEAVLIPAAGLGFAGESWELEQARHIRIDSLVPSEKQQSVRPELREAARLKKRLMGMAYEKLSRAKALHDELEGVYKPHMDFAALTKFTAAEIKRLFK